MPCPKGTINCPDKKKGNRKTNSTLNRIAQSGRTRVTDLKTGKQYNGIPKRR